MGRESLRSLLGILVIGVGVGCRTPPDRPYRLPPPPELRPARIDYADTDAFDVFLETALVNREPVILIQTMSTQPDWAPRLSEWLAAWNMGGKVAPPPRAVRGQVPTPTVTVDGESIREFRLLIEGLMDRIEDIASRKSAWWSEERLRSRRIALLKPYNLRFHRDEEKRIQIIFFNGEYADSYEGFMRTLMRDATPEEREWSRTYECSDCE